MLVRVGKTYYQVPLSSALLILAILVGFWALGTGVYTVDAESQAVVLRFGKYARTVDPGLHFKLPFGIEKAYQLPVRRQLKQEFGFATAGATNPLQYTSPSEQERERNMITGDLSAAIVEWVIQYRISDPFSFLFQFRRPAETLRDLSEAVMREVIGDRTVDEVITVGRQEIEQEALAKLRAMVERYGLGVTIDQLQLKNVNPPAPVQPSFNEVNQAQQEREKLINEARAEYNRVIPRAQGQALERIRAAEGYALRRVNEAEGDAARFNAIFEQYLRAPEVTRRRLYLETLAEVLPRVKRIWIVDQRFGNVLPLLQLGAEEEGKR